MQLMVIDMVKYYLSFTHMKTAGFNNPAVLILQPTVDQQN